MKLHIPLTFKCLYCDREFRSVEARVSHERHKHPPVVAVEAAEPDGERFNYIGFFR